VRVLFRVDGGRIWGVSMGHIFRCMALAKELQNKYHADIIFLMKDYKDGVQIVKDKQFNVHTINCEIGNAKELEIIDKWKGDIVVFDLIDIAEKNVGRLSDKNRQIVVIDDTGEKRIESDVIINGSIVKKFHHYIDNGRNTDYYLGSEYCILDEEFSIPQKKEKDSVVKKILIFMGGSDIADLTIKIARFFKKETYLYNLIFILGPGFVKYKELHDKLSSYQGYYDIYKSPKSVAPLFHSADIAILTGGRSLYEAAFMGLTGIVIPSIEHEKLVAEEFANREAFLSLSYSNNLPDYIFEKKLKNLLDRILNDRILRKKMEGNALSIIDGNGRKRVAKIIYNTRNVN